jgi:Flp pilus assembly protein TadB
VSTSEKGIGIAAVIMAVCCAVLPLAGGALAGGLAFGAGTVGVIAGIVVFVAVLTFVLRRRRSRQC